MKSEAYEIAFATTPPSTIVVTNCGGGMCLSNWAKSGHCVCIGMNIWAHFKLCKGVRGSLKFLLE